MEPPAARQVAPDGWLATALKCEHCSHFAAHRDSTLTRVSEIPHLEVNACEFPASLLAAAFHAFL